MSTLSEAINIPLDSASFASIRIYLSVIGFSIETVFEPSAILHVESIQGRKRLTLDGGCTASNVEIVLHHDQGRMTQVLLQQVDIASIQQKPGSIGVPKQMRVQPGDSDGS